MPAEPLLLVVPLRTGREPDRGTVVPLEAQEVRQALEVGHAHAFF